MAKQTDWWLLPAIPVIQVTQPILAELEKVCSILGEDDATALGTSIMGRLENVYQASYNRAKVAPSMAAGITLTSSAASWVLGPKSAPLLEDETAIMELTITNECTTDGDVIITVDNVDYEVALTTALNTAALVAEAVVAELNQKTAITEEYTLSRTDAVITFTADSVGERQDVLYDSADTGATGETVVIKHGIGSYPFHLYWITVEAVSDVDTYEIVLEADDQELGRVRVAATAAQDRGEPVSFGSPILPAGTTVRARVASGLSKVTTITISLRYHVFDFIGIEPEEVV